jgi:hypothetical protein
LGNGPAFQVYDLGKKKLEGVDIKRINMLVNKKARHDSRMPPVKQ